MKNRSTIKIGGFYFSEILENETSVSRNLGRLLYYECSQKERENLGYKYDSWFLSYCSFYCYWLNFKKRSLCYKNICILRCVGLLLYELCFRQKAVDLLSLNLGPEWEMRLPELPIELASNLGRIYRKLLLTYKYFSFFIQVKRSYIIKNFIKGY